MFRKSASKKHRATPEYDPSEFRVHERKVIRDLRVYVDKQLVEVLDYSDGGVRIRSDRPLGRTVVIEVIRSGQVVRENVAVQAWQRGNQTGYAFRPKLKVTAVAGSPPRDRVDSLENARNPSGGVSGSALRNRLKL